MIKAFLFDIGNVLLGFDFDIAIRNLNAHSPVRIDQVDRILVDVKNVYESGGMSRADFVREARTLLKYDGTDDEFTEMWQRIFSPNLPVWEVVDRLRPQYPLYLLSNTSDLHLDYIFEEYRVFDAFTDGVYSHLAGCMKPDPRIYHTAIESLSLAPSHTVFIDDMEENIAAAREIGFRCHHYRADRHDDLLAFLEGEGVKPAAGG